MQSVDAPASADDEEGARISSEATAFNLELFTPYRVVVLGRRMSESLSSAYADQGLSIPEWRVLAVVSQASLQNDGGDADKTGGMAARDVVSKTPMDKMAVSRATVSLEQKGLIKRHVSPADRRVQCLKLTPLGCDVFQRAAEAALAYEAKLLSRLSVSDRNQLAALLSKVEAITLDGERPEEADPEAL